MGTAKRAICALLNLGKPYTQNISSSSGNPNVNHIFTSKVHLTFSGLFVVDQAFINLAATKGFTVPPKTIGCVARKTTDIDLTITWGFSP